MSYKSETELPENNTTGAEEDQTLEYWSNEFGISKDELIASIKAGGTLTEALRKYLKEVEFAA